MSPLPDTGLSHPMWANRKPGMAAVTQAKCTMYARNAEGARTSPSVPTSPTWAQITATKPPASGNADNRDTYTDSDHKPQQKPPNHMGYRPGEPRPLSTLGGMETDSTPI